MNIHEQCRFPNLFNTSCGGVGSDCRDSCQGDSGGPLFSNVRTENGSVFVIVGIVSWGRGCADGYPGVYTRVSEVSDFINLYYEEKGERLYRSTDEYLRAVFKQLTEGPEKLEECLDLRYDEYEGEVCAKVESGVFFDVHGISRISTYTASTAAAVGVVYNSKEQSQTLEIFWETNETDGSSTFDEFEISAYIHRSERNGSMLEVSAPGLHRWLPWGWKSKECQNVSKTNEACSSLLAVEYDGSPTFIWYSPVDFTLSACESRHW